MIRDACFVLLLLLVSAIVSAQPSGAPAPQPSSSPPSPGGETGPVAAPRVSSKHPNVILIVADDLGYADLGCQGSTDLRTPNIDSLATGGARFTNAYVTAPVCSPSRAGLLTGRYQQRFGHEFNTGPFPPADVGLPVTEITLAQVLKGVPYATGAVGKWHLGTAEPFHPQQRGFDEFFGFLSGSRSYTSMEKDDPKPLLRSRDPVAEEGYLTDVLTREAVAYIDRHSKESFFLYVAYTAPHSPMQATPKYLERFAHITDKKRRTMAAMVSAMDDGVGAMLAALKEKKIDEKTVVIFLSDNGGPTKVNTSRNDPFSGSKGELREGGIRVPLLVRWPGKVKPGQVIDVPVIALDLFTTICAIADTKPPADRTIDGVSLVPLLTGQKSDPPHAALFWRYGETFAIRAGNEKLLRERDDQQPKLFDLSSDPAEKNDLAASQPDRVKSLTAEWNKWNAEQEKPLWRYQAGDDDDKAPRKPATRPATAPAAGVLP